MFFRLFQRRKDRRYEEFRKWIQVHEAAKTLNFITCLYCHVPACSEEANFCANCGASFHTEPGRYTTEPLQVPERPFLAYLKHQHEIEKANTQKTRVVPLNWIEHVRFVQNQTQKKG